MLKKLFVFLNIILMASFLAACSSEADPEKEARRTVSLLDLKDEPPMTEGEILLYIKVLPEFAPFENAQDPAGEMNFYKKYKLTKNRFFYLRGKIGYASLSIAGMPLDLSSVPESLHPGDDELRIVRDNFAALKEATDEFNEFQRNR